MMLKLKLQYLATSCEELTHWKRLWCWEGLGVGREGDNRGWDSWMASPTHWTWVWVNSGSWWWTERPGMLQFMGSPRVGHDWATELNKWTKKWIPWTDNVQVGLFWFAIWFGYFALYQVKKRNVWDLCISLLINIFMYYCFNTLWTLLK